MTPTNHQSQLEGFLDQALGIFSEVPQEAKRRVARVKQADADVHAAPIKVAPKPTKSLDPDVASAKPLSFEARPLPAEDVGPSSLGNFYKDPETWDFDTDLKEFRLTKRGEPYDVVYEKRIPERFGGPAPTTGQMFNERVATEFRRVPGDFDGSIEAAPASLPTDGSDGQGGAGAVALPSGFMDSLMDRSGPPRRTRVKDSVLPPPRKPMRRAAVKPPSAKQGDEDDEGFFDPEVSDSDVADEGPAPEGPDMKKAALARQEALRRKAEEEAARKKAEDQAARKRAQREKQQRDEYRKDQWELAKHNGALGYLKYATGVEMPYLSEGAAPAKKVKPPAPAPLRPPSPPPVAITIPASPPGLRRASAGGAGFHSSSVDRGLLTQFGSFFSLGGGASEGGSIQPPKPKAKPKATPPKANPPPPPPPVYASVAGEAPVRRSARQTTSPQRYVPHTAYTTHPETAPPQLRRRKAPTPQREAPPPPPRQRQPSAPRAIVVPPPSTEPPSNLRRGTRERKQTQFYQPGESETEKKRGGK
jgi:hypothetical protein